MTRTLHVHRLGTVPYATALALQERLVEARIAGAIEDCLLLLEHPPVVTLGRGAKRDHLLVSEELLASEGVGATSRTTHRGNSSAIRSCPSTQSGETYAGTWLRSRRS